MNVIVKPYLENIDTNVEGNAISVRATVGLNIKSYYKINKDYIKDVIEGAEEAKEKKASVTIYVVGDGESLWDIGKKYNTTVSELERLNDLNIISLNRQLNPITVIINTKSEDILNEIYSLLI